MPTNATATAAPPGTAVPKGARLTGEERRKLGIDLAARYRGGTSIRELATASGRSYGFVHRLLRECGVTMRPQGGASHTRPRRPARKPPRLPGAPPRRVQ
jgi:hypothetical protein